MTRRENVILAMRHMNTPWIPYAGTDCNIVIQSAAPDRYEGRESGFDAFGVEYQYDEKCKGPVQKPGKKVVSDVLRWKEQVRFPDLDAVDWEAAAARDTAGWDRINRFSIVQMNKGMFERAHHLMNYEDVCCALLEEPGVMGEWFEAHTDYRVKMIKYVAEYYKPDAVMVFDDYGTNLSMVMSPETWRKLVKPRLKRLIDATHECGMFYIMHSCGYIVPIFDDIAELGADCINPVQVVNNPAGLKKKYGNRICFYGGFNNQQVFDREGVTEEEVRAEVKRTLEEMAPGGSFLATSSTLCQLKEAFFDELKKAIVPQMIAAGIEIPEEFK